MQRLISFSMLGEKVEKLDKVKENNGGDGEKKKAALRVLSPSANSHLGIKWKEYIP